MAAAPLIPQDEGKNKDKKNDKKKNKKDKKHKKADVPNGIPSVDEMAEVSHA
jgi:hypothetical protein